MLKANTIDFASAHQRATAAINISMYTYEVCVRRVFFVYRMKEKKIMIYSVDRRDLNEEKSFLTLEN